MTSWDELRIGASEVAGEWRAARSDRQARRHLEPADFDRLRSIGFLATAVPEPAGGLWRNLTESTRPIAEALRCLARGDPSVALVSATDQRNRGPTYRAAIRIPVAQTR